MKKILTVALLGFMGYGASAQNVFVLGNYNMANITKNSSGSTDESKMLSTLGGGVLGRFNISKSLDLESGLMLNGRGAKYNTYATSDHSDNYVKSKFNPFYLDIPLNLVLKLPSNKTNLFIHGGMYGGIGLFGKSKVQTRTLGISGSSETDIQFANEDNTNAGLNKIRRFDYGVNLGGGATFGGVMVRANYGLGLAKIPSTQANATDDRSNKHRVITLSVGIPLNRKGA